MSLQVIRKTGKYYYLIVITSFFPIIALTSFIFLNEDSGFFHSWLTILPSGFGFASVITAGLSKFSLYLTLLYLTDTHLVHLRLISRYHRICRSK